MQRIGFCLTKAFRTPRGRGRAHLQKEDESKLPGTEAAGKTPIVEGEQPSAKEVVIQFLPQNQEISALHCR